MQESQPSKRNKSKEQKRQANAYLKYSGMAFQMGITIGIFAYIGQKLDGRFGTETPYWTVGFSLLGVFIALYFLLKDVLQK